MKAVQSINDLDVDGRRVLLRLDLNVPVDEGQISDETRIERTLPTIRNLTARGARVVILSHRGRPKGERDLGLSLTKVWDTLARLLREHSVQFATDCIGPIAIQAVEKLGKGEILVLENLRFHAGEEENDSLFAGALAALGDLYVNDAFSCSHRAHASIDALARQLPAAVGPSMETELDALHKVLDTPARPVIAIIGGSKISTKLTLLENLCVKVDAIAIGGGMANTFLLARGYNVGCSLCEPSLVTTAQDIELRANETNCRIILPRDVVTALTPDSVEAIQNVPVDHVAADQMILDLGSDSSNDLAIAIQSYHTLIWNGPLGFFEKPPFDASTNRVAAAVRQFTASNRLISICGGGDTLSALRRSGSMKDFSYLSTGGGAFLHWLEGKQLPGIAVLMK